MGLCKGFCKEMVLRGRKDSGRGEGLYIFRDICKRLLFEAGGEREVSVERSVEEQRLCLLCYSSCTYSAAPQQKRSMLVADRMLQCQIKDKVHKTQDTRGEEDAGLETDFQSCKSHRTASLQGGSQELLMYSIP